jgi:hypothetical protein
MASWKRYSSRACDITPSMLMLMRLTSEEINNKLVTETKTSINPHPKTGEI